MQLGPEGRVSLQLWWTGLLRDIYQGMRRRIQGTLASGFLIETCIACFHSNQKKDKTATIIRFRIKLIVILANGL